MKKIDSFILFLKESITLTDLSKKLNALDKQLTALYLQLGLMTYNISEGISDDEGSVTVVKNKITSVKQDIADLTKAMEKRGLLRAIKD